jgi:subtilisin family serine protease
MVLNARLYILLLLLLLASSLTASDYFSSEPVLGQSFEMQLDLADPTEQIDCIIILNPIVISREDKEALSIPEKINLYRQEAYDVQEALIRELELEMGGDIKIDEQFWFPNSFMMRGTPPRIKRIAKKKDVKKISRNGGVRMYENPPVELAGMPNTGSPVNIFQIEARRCWNAGVTGQDVIIGHTDTGVDYSHPALRGSFSGYWYDAINGEPRPYDDHGHGTHTIGTLLGGDGNGEFPYDIGVAPQAKWVGVKVMDENGKGTYEQCFKGLQYLAELKATVDIKIVLGSWSVEDKKEDLFVDICKTFLDLDILPIFAVGNSGPDAGSAEVPANYPHVLAVGAVDQNNQVVSFSSRGPAQDIVQWNDSGFWLDTAWQRTKPDMCAPGVSVLSSTLDGSYSLWDGSSMAAPHVAGAAALLISHDRSLTPFEVYDLLASGAGNTILPDNNTGWGVVNAWDSLVELDSAFEEIDNLIPGGEKSSSVNKAREQAGKSKLGSFGNSGTIRFSLPIASEVNIGIYDLAGRLVKTLPGGTYVSGEHVVNWNGRDNKGRSCNSGVYFVRLSGSDMRLTSKLMLMH